MTFLRLYLTLVNKCNVNPFMKAEMVINRLLACKSPNLDYLYQINKVYFCLTSFAWPSHSNHGRPTSGV